MIQTDSQLADFLPQLEPHDRMAALPPIEAMEKLIDNLNATKTKRGAAAQWTEMNRKAPNAKLQAPEKLQTSKTNQTTAMVCCLVLGISLELGAWSLELRD